MNRIYVVAGTQAEFLHYAKKDSMKRWNAGETSISLSNYIYIRSPDQLRGLSEVHGVFTGSYKNRQDLEELCINISIINRLPYNLYESIR